VGQNGVGRRPRRAQQAETAERTAGLAADGLRGEGGQRWVEVGIEKGPAADAGAPELVEGTAEGGLIGDAADDEMRVLRVESAEGGCRLGDGVAGLDDLLAWGKVFADEHVQIRDLVEHAPPPGWETPGERP
jgi:hypothetical protein